MVEYLAKAAGLRTERVNNTKATTVQSYLGSIMPDGTFQPGPLIRAICSESELCVLALISLRSHFLDRSV